MAEAMENGSDSPEMEMTRTLIERFEKSEYEVRVTLPSPEGKFELFGKLDSYSPKLHSFREYKTGKVPWTQAKVDGSKQITFYCMLLYLAKKKMPKNIYLDWIETEVVNGEIQSTGNIKTFATTRKVQDVLRLGAEVGKIAREISDDYRNFIKV